MDQTLLNKSMRHYEFTEEYSVLEEFFDFMLRCKLSSKLLESAQTDRFDNFIQIQTLPKISSLVVGQKYFPLVVMCAPGDNMITYKSSSSECELTAISKALVFSDNSKTFLVDPTFRSIMSGRIFPVIFSNKDDRDKFITSLELKFGFQSTFISF